MRLGTWNCNLAQGSKVAEVYGKEQITERHRHRFEFNNQYKTEVFEKGAFKVLESIRKPVWWKLLKIKITLGLSVYSFTLSTKAPFPIHTPYL